MPAEHCTPFSERRSCGTCTTYHKRQRIVHKLVTHLTTSFIYTPIHDRPKRGANLHWASVQHAIFVSIAVEYG